MPDLSLRGFLLNPLIDLLSVTLQSIFGILGQVTQYFFEQGAIVSVLNLFQWFCICMFVVGVAMSLMDFATDFLDGNMPSGGVLAKNIIKGFFVTLFFQKIMILSYQIGHYLTESLFAFSSFDTKINVDSLSSLITGGVVDVILSLLILLLFLVIGIMLAFQFLERNAMFLLHLCMLPFYIIGICRGYHEPFAMWIRQGVAFSASNLLQMLMIILMFVFLKSGTTMFFAVGCGLAATKVENIMQSFAFTTGSRGSVGAAGEALKSGLQSAAKAAV